MRRSWLLLMVALSLANSSGMLRAGTPVDVHCPQACNNCGHEVCIERAPVQDCVVGEKKVYTTSIHKQYVTIPEVRYKFQMVFVEKEIPAEYCKTVCEPKTVDHQYQAEHWEKQTLPCGDELHCKTCETKTEKLTQQECKTEKGKTTIKVHYWSCVKVPYTVYRQVEKEVCVKQPRTEKVCVSVTRYECQNCGGIGCALCRGITSLGPPCVGPAAAGQADARPVGTGPASAGPVGAGQINVPELPQPASVINGGAR
ncbi:MAG: hypothetical protein ABSG53_18730 [Thermoguttaceae bacterium]